ncbi:MAG: transporter substrate-binding domain-containing protein, partial [Lachnospiraceae bacterium]|nr:transporter substrate-binding domain-containing protein [Lachnospiraceae bacterium]
MLALSLVACGASTQPAQNAADAEETAEEEEAEAPAEEETQEAAADAAEGGITGDGVATPGVLVMATNAEFPPYEFKDDGVNIVGIDAEIAEKIAEKLG